MTFFWEQSCPDMKRHLKQLAVVSECPLKDSFTFHSCPLQNMQKEQQLPEILVLQLRATYIVIYSEATQEIIDFVECSPQVYFFIREVGASSPNQSEITNSNEQHYLYVRFSNEHYPGKPTTFIIDKSNKQRLEYFGILLGKQFIKQLDFHRLFKPVRVLGKGLTATVYAAKRLSDSSSIAIKAFKKSSYFSMGDGRGEKAFQKEFKILTECNHSNLCQFHGTFQTQNTIYIIMEQYHKPLISLLSSPAAFSRSQVLELMEQLLKGVHYLHSKRIMHRDLKLQNIMLRKTNTGYRPIIIDLGMAEYIDQQTYLFDKCGTPGYAAPEMFIGKSKSPQKCDIFSLGVIFYAILFRKPVFVGQTKNQILQNNRNGKMVLDMEAMEEDPLIADLLLKMLTISDSQRISAEDALNHKLFNSETQLTPSLSTACTVVPAGVLDWSYDI